MNVNEVHCTFTGNSHSYQGVAQSSANYLRSSLHNTNKFKGKVLLY